MPKTTNHTPSPWIVKGEQSEGMLCVTDTDSRYIVDRFTLGDRPTEEHLANARLIAAAPDLIDALRNILAVVDSDSRHIPDRILTAIDRCRVSVARVDDAPET